MVRGDFSRQTFDADQHYSAVLMQQGRVQVDADWNEQQAINRHRAEADGANLVGPAGAPRTAPGFSITPQGNDLLIGRGHYYLDGILCENERDLLLTEQPDLPQLDQSPLPTTDGLYLAYLEAWERHLTALEAPAIRETALGGPDTATRTKTVWQVRLLPVTDPGGTPTCATTFPEWTQLLQQNLVDIPNPGRMRAQSQPEDQSPDPQCVLPPGTGFRRLENQLHRVEIHQGGDRTTARFKWSRDNGTVATAIQPDENGVVVRGSVISVAEIGKDGTLSFASDPLPEWLELTDDRFELVNQRGELAPLLTIDPAARTITFAQAATLPVLAAGHHPVVRRWDQRGITATAQGVGMTGDWQELEDGVQVRFDDGLYRAGDYWLVPARAAIGFETGTVEWPRDASGPLARPPLGTRHRLTRLALLRRQSGAFVPVPGGDCRPIFPPLTAITAGDVNFVDTTCQLGVTDVQQALDALCQRGNSYCTLQVGPEQDLAAAVSQLLAGQDALICLSAGTYPLVDPIRLENAGHLHVTGAGRGTRIVAATSEAALLFSNCASVKVSSLSVETGVVGRGKGGPLEGLNGSLTFLDCPSVTVVDANVRCAGGPIRAAACVAVRHTAVVRGTSASIQDCDLEVGHLQTGAIMVNVDRVRAVDNVVRAGARPADDVMLEDLDYRGTLRRQLLTGFATGAAAPTTSNATVNFNGQVVHFRTEPSLVHGNRNNNDWQAAVTAINPSGITNPSGLIRFLRTLASDLLRSRGTGPGGSQFLRNVIAAVLQQDTPAVDQGIVLTGITQADAVWITGNRVSDAVQGIHVGFGPEAAGGAAGVVVVNDNVVRMSLPSSATRERHGLFVGHCNSLAVESNFIDLVRPPLNAGLRTEGMRIFGNLGRRAIVRHNHMGPLFTVGITFAPLNAQVPAQPLWIVTENVMESAATRVDLPAKLPGQPGIPDPNTVRARLLGLASNFA